MSTSSAAGCVSSRGNGGYDMEFLNEVPSALECSICQLTLRDPVQVRDCGHRFCKTCIDLHQRVNGAWCPNDRNPLGIDKLFDDMACKRHVLSLFVKCSNKECTWTGELSNLEDHLKLSCEFECIPCSNTPCPVFMIRADIKKHVNEGCEWRSIICVLCGRSNPMCKKDALCIQHEQYLDRLDKMEEHYKALQDEYDKKVNEARNENHILNEEIQGLESRLNDNIQQQEIQFKQIDNDAQQRHKHTLSTLTFFGFLVIVLALFSHCAWEIKSLKQENSNLHNEVINIKTELKEELSSSMEMVFAEISKQVQDMSTTIKTDVGKKLQETLDKINVNSNFGQLHLRVENIMEEIKKGNENKDRYFIDSPAIYSHYKGYKIKMRVFPGGVGSGAGGYLSVAVVIMRGDHDYHPRMWPFRKTVRFTLIDQNDIANRRNHITADLTPGAAGSDASFMRPIEAENKHRAIELFYSQYNLRQGSYIRDDTLLLKMEIL